MKHITPIPLRLQYLTVKNLRSVYPQVCATCIFCEVELLNDDGKQVPTLSGNLKCSLPSGPVYDCESTDQWYAVCDEWRAEE